MKSDAVYVWLNSTQNTFWVIKLLHPVTQTCTSASAAHDDICAK